MIGLAGSRCVFSTAEEAHLVDNQSVFLECEETGDVSIGCFVLLECKETVPQLVAVLVMLEMCDKPCRWWLSCQDAVI